MTFAIFHFDGIVDDVIQVERNLWSHCTAAGAMFFKIFCVDVVISRGFPILENLDCLGDLIIGKGLRHGA